jgi:hypothetical protein
MHVSTANMQCNLTPSEGLSAFQTEAVNLCTYYREGMDTMFGVDLGCFDAMVRSHPLMKGSFCHVGSLPVPNGESKESFLSRRHYSFRRYCIRCWNYEGVEKTTDALSAWTPRPECA